ncbi:RDD family protein [Halolactibacillus alkaliphilus]|uniref:RDD family protein n=3 Tax=Halolactibacillus alkaliphilus TaxID=442899 RepID=UPI000B7DF3DA
MASCISMNTLTASPVGVIERGIALIIDLIINVIIALIISFVFHKGNFSFFDFYIIALVILSHVYSIILPLLWNGYTIGKRVMGIRIAPILNNRLTLSRLIFREFLVKNLLYRFRARRHLPQVRQH